jgi:hypothetical protein
MKVELRSASRFADDSSNQSPQEQNVSKLSGLGVFSAFPAFELFVVV